MFEDLNESTRKAFLYGLRVPGYWDGIGDAPFSLHIVHMHIGVRYTEEQLQTLETLSAIEQGKARAKVWTDVRAREKTLTYLNKLLEDGVVKVGQWLGKDGIADEYLGTPDEIIERIRTEWSTAVSKGEMIDATVYEMSIHIVLKENLWPVWR
jgi:hypothetical protein